MDGRVSRRDRCLRRGIAKKMLNQGSFDWRHVWRSSTVWKSEALETLWVWLSALSLMVSSVLWRNNFTVAADMLD